MFCFLFSLLFHYGRHEFNAMLQLFPESVSIAVFSAGDNRALTKEEEGEGTGVAGRVGTKGDTRC